MTQDVLQSHLVVAKSLVVQVAATPNLPVAAKQLVVQADVVWQHLAVVVKSLRAADVTADVHLRSAVC